MTWVRPHGGSLRESAQRLFSLGAIGLCRDGLLPHGRLLMLYFILSLLSFVADKI